MKAHEFDYRWTLKDANFTKGQRKGLFLFCLWGGSTMGYKLAGYDVIGCNEIDHRMMYAYCRNNNPKFPFLNQYRLSRKEPTCRRNFTTF